MTLSWYTLFTGLLLPTPGVRETQGVAFYLRKFFFSGSRLCQGMSPSSSGDSYRRVYSSRLPFRAQFCSVKILVGQEDVQSHFGPFQASTKLCLYWGLLYKPWPLLCRAIFCNNIFKGFSNTWWWNLQCYFYAAAVFYLGAFDSIACYKQVYGLSKTYYRLNCYSGFAP